LGGYSTWARTRGLRIYKITDGEKDVYPMDGLVINGFVMDHFHSGAGCSISPARHPCGGAISAWRINGPGCALDCPKII
jgi:hypothetical protein